MKNTALKQSDKEALSCFVDILDGRYGSELEVVATTEGLELGGYITLPWE